MTAEQLKYREAIERLDEIISQIEGEDVDVDELSLQVKEAVELIRVCKAKIDKAEMEVKRVVEDFSKENKETENN
jgi:exodeoxyribonuclease VII small subunit